MISRDILLFFVSLYVFMTVANAQEYEGDACDVDGERGICRKLQDCPAANTDIRLGKSPPPTCGFDKNDIIVCCKKVVEVLTTTKRTLEDKTTEYTPAENTYVDVDSRGGDNDNVCGPIPAVATRQPTGQKAWDKCLEYQEKYVFPCEKSASIAGGLGRTNRCHHNADELVIGGTAAKTHEFPHMVLLGYQDQHNHIEWQCGGSLISEKFILTAAHCTTDSREVNVSHALIGILKRSDQSPERRYGIKRFFKHGAYASPNKYDDIALLELDREVKLSHKTTPACLHNGDLVDLSRASATGWGTTHINRQVNSDVLQKVILTSFRKKECADLYSYHRQMKEGFKPASQLCYGDRTKSQDTCRGDSGGPLQVKSKSIACMYIIVGVTSFGIECGRAGFPGIYTRVSHYLPWIESIVWPDEDYPIKSNI